MGALERLKGLGLDELEIGRTEDRVGARRLAGVLGVKRLRVRWLRTVFEPIGEEDRNTLAEWRNEGWSVDDDLLSAVLDPKKSERWME